LVRGLLNETGGWYQITLVNMLRDISRNTIEMALRFQFVNSEYIYERIKEFDFDWFFIICLAWFYLVDVYNCVLSRKLLVIV